MLINGVRVIQDPEELRELLMQCTVVSFDTETSGLDPHTARIELMQFHGVDRGVAGLIKTPGGMIPESIRKFFAEYTGVMITHNGPNFDWLFLHTHDIPWKRINWYDTLIGESVVTVGSRRRVRMNLKDTLLRNLGMDIDKTVSHSWTNEVLTERQIEYAIIDVLGLSSLRQIQIERAEETNQMPALLMEQKIAKVFAQMAVNGLILLPDRLREYVANEQEKVDRLSTLIFAQIGVINLNSPVQIKRALLGFGIEINATSKEALEDAIMDGLDVNNVLANILEIRHALQRVKMYDEDWIRQHIHNGRVHAKFWQMGTDTGRSSSSNPNLQQVPRDGRKVFGGLKGWKYVSCDYSQIEVRVAAAMAKDRNMIESLQSEDIHTAVAAQIFQIKPSEVTKDQRKIAKACSFTLIFGGGANRLYQYARHNGSDLTLQQAEGITSKFMTGFPGLANMKQNALVKSRYPGPVVLRLPNSLRRVLVGPDKTLTRILNTMVQGTAAIGLKKGLEIMLDRGLDIYLGATVHDELVACVPEAEAEEYGRKMQECMIEGMKQYVPIEVKAELSIGNTW